MNTLLDILQLTSSILIIIAILLQQRGSGLSSTFGGSGEFYHAKRGFEKVLLISTVILAIVFLGTALLRIII